MNPRILLVSLVLAATATAQNADPRQQADAYYNQGIAAEKAGDPAAARNAYNTALRLNPRHTQARFRIGQLKSTSGAIASRGRETKIGAVMIPEIKLDAATLPETLDLLSKMIEKESEGKIAPNFVIQDPKNALKDAAITMQLKSVPTSAILKYITAQTGAKLRYDEHAIVIEPR